MRLTGSSFNNTTFSKKNVHRQVRETICVKSQSVFLHLSHGSLHDSASFASSDRK